MNIKLHRRSVVHVLLKHLWVVFLWIITTISLAPLMAGEVDQQTELESTIHARGLGIGVKDRQGKEVILYKESHALVIGVSNYTRGWPKLPGVQRDVQEVKAVLEVHGFNVVVEMDVERTALEQSFDRFINAYGHDPDNRLVVYFAGHGYTRKLAYGGEMGYIIPADAPLSDEDERGFFAKAMDMQMIEVYARRIQSKHALFVFDSCFSGSIFAITRAAPEHITHKTSRPVRQFLTSGSANEQVPDESVFRQQFIAALQGESDHDGDGYVTGSELGMFLENTVINYTNNTQHPQYGKIRDPYLDKGDFVFQLPGKHEEEPTPIVPPKITASFDDIKAQLKWEEYLSKMEEEFSTFRRYEALDIPAESKIAAWERFLQAFSADNPHSTHDEELRGTANERIQYWKAGGLLTPTPTALPLTPLASTPTAQLPTSTPRPSGIEQLLKQADTYFDKRWFLTPENTNAFAVYQEVLKLDPTNRHAREKLHEMIKTYKAWGDANYQKVNYAKAKTFYQRSLKIAQYMAESLGDQTIIQEFQKVQEQLQTLEATPMPSPTPMPSATLTLPPTPQPPTPTPTPIPTPTPLPKPVAGQEWHDPVSGIDFVWVPEGCFQMGCVSGIDCADDEEPVHRVCLDGYWLGKYEVTQVQWQQVMKINPSRFQGGSRPVETVSWDAVQQFLRTLNEQAGQERYRLPSEAEWEYAARAGTQTVYSFGNDTEKSSEYAWYNDNSGDTTRPVGQLKPNAWGLYDMHGNVWEWCQDRYDAKYYSKSPSKNPQGPSSGSFRVLRGGSWANNPDSCRSAFRNRYNPVNRVINSGFRVVGGVVAWTQ